MGREETLYPRLLANYLGLQKLPIGINSNYQSSFNARTWFYSASQNNNISSVNNRWEIVCTPTRVAHWESCHKTMMSQSWYHPTSWPIKQLNVSNASLHGSIRGSQHGATPGIYWQTLSPHVCKLRKAIYGLKQAPWAWINKLARSLFGRICLI